MSKSNSFESDVLKLVFNATGISLLADNTATTPLTNLFISLHTTDPGETGTQTTGEIAYTGYARVAVVRTSSGWTISGTAPTQAANTAAINFPACTGGTAATASFFAVGATTSSAGEIYYSGAITTPLAISTGITPSFAISALVVTED
jgi:hypothetical protein